MVATEGFPPGHNGEGRCVCRASQPVSGIDGIRVVENRFLCGVRTWAIYHSGFLISPRREVRVDSP